jgi:hypothetical protein
MDSTEPVMRQTSNSGHLLRLSASDFPNQLEQLRALR